jgi:hypothetical protein
VVVDRLLELGLERGQPLVDQVRLVVARRQRLVVRGVLVLHGGAVWARGQVGPGQEGRGGRRRRQHVRRAPAHGRQGQERGAGGREVDLPGAVAALVRLVAGVGPV